MRALAKLALCLAAVWFAGCSSESRPESKTKPSAEPAPVRILQFYASPGAVERGDSVMLCYGVEHAAAVRLEPAVAQIEPSPNRCIQFTPERSRTYTLIAGGAGAAQATQSLEIQVEPRSAKSRPAAGGGSLIQTFAASAEQVAPGQQVTICYVVRGADSVRLEPAVGELAASGKGCLVVTPTQTVTYKLTASARDRTDRQSLTIRVKQ